MIKRIVSLLVLVLTAAIFSVSAAAVMNLNIVGSYQITTDQAYDRVIDLM